jgi:hypothetical protein
VVAKMAKRPSRNKEYAIKIGLPAVRGYYLTTPKIWKGGQERGKL